MSDDVIRIEISFNASIEKVWNAWTDPHLVLQWFGSDPNGKGVKAVLDVQPGRHYEIAFKDGDGTEHTCMGKYLNVEKFKQLSFTWEWKNEPGVQSLVTVLLSARNNTSHMIFEHKNVGAASAHNYLVGWKATFSKLEEVLRHSIQPT